MTISKANKEDTCEKNHSNVPFPKSVTVSFSEAATSSVSSLQHQDFFLFLFYLYASGEIIWQLVRANGYFRTFPPIAKLHTVHSVKLWTFKISLLLIAPHFAVHRASYCLTTIPILSQGNWLLISSFALRSVSQAMKKNLNQKRKKNWGLSG